MRGDSSQVVAIINSPALVAPCSTCRLQEPSGREVARQHWLKSHCGRLSSLTEQFGKTMASGYTAGCEPIKEACLHELVIHVEGKGPVLVEIECPKEASHHGFSKLQ